MKRIQADFSTVYQRSAESAMVNEQLARLEAFYMKALKTVVAALRTAATNMRDLREFQKFVGLINEQQENSLADQLGCGFGFWGVQK